MLHSMWDLSSWPGIKPEPRALEAQSLNHWIAWEVPQPRHHSWISKLFFNLVLCTTSLLLYLSIKIPTLAQ